MGSNTGSTTECSVRSNGEYDRMGSTTECGVRPNARYDRKACTIEWHTAHERITCSTIQWDGGYDPIAFLTRMPLHKVPPFIRECVFHFYTLATSLTRKLSGKTGGLNLIHLRR